MFFINILSIILLIKDEFLYECVDENLDIGVSNEVCFWL